MGENTYTLLGSHARRIRELVDKKRYKTDDEFVRMAIELLLDWESGHPEDCMDRMKSMRPFTPEQEAFMVDVMDPDERKRQFGEFEADRAGTEGIIQTRLARRNDDHKRLSDGLGKTEAYLRDLQVKEPENPVPYSGYPRLSGFYSRLLPVKIVVSVLAYLLAERGTDRVELNETRAHAYDIAEEIADILIRTEARKKTSRNKKMSTGLPKKGMAENDKEKMAPAQKRFKDQFVGKIRKNRGTGNAHFDGALSALGLVYAYEEGGKTFVSFTDLGRRFAMMRNPVMSGNYEGDPFSKEESEFVLEELMPRLELEKMFIDSALDVVEKYGGARNEKISDLLNKGIRMAKEEYDKKHPEHEDGYGASRLDITGDPKEKKVSQWRLATMGRLAELGAVEWTINERGESEYSIGR